MAFIAVNAKADIDGSKKGKVNPAQNAQLNSWFATEKTGILDFEGRCTAKQETSITVTSGKAEVVFNNGYVLVYGRLVECEDSTKVSVSAPVSGEEKGSIYLRFNLGAEKGEEFYAIATTETVGVENLNVNPSDGVCDFELYKYTATPYTVSLERTNRNYVKSVEEIMNGLIAKDGGIKGWDVHVTQPDVSKYEDGSLNVNYKTKYPINRYSFYDGSGEGGFAELLCKDVVISGEYNLNGMIWGMDSRLNEIDRRLDEMGFREGSVTGIDGATLTAMGKYAILKFPEHYQGQVKETIQVEFPPKETVEIHFGNITFSFVAGSTSVEIYNLVLAKNAQIGYEIQ